MNVDNWIRDIINVRERCTVPIMTHPGIEMIGATVKDAVQSGEKHAQAIYDRLPVQEVSVEGGYRDHGPDSRSGSVWEFHRIP